MRTLEFRNELILLILDRKHLPTIVLNAIARAGIYYSKKGRNYYIIFHHYTRHKLPNQHYSVVWLPYSYVSNN